MLHKLTVKSIVMPFAAMILPVGVMAQSASILPLIQRTDLPVNMAVSPVYEANPAMMVHYDSLSLSSLYLSGDYLHESKARMEQLGTGHTLFSAGAESYSRLGSNQVVWGEASFTTGSYRDIRWTDCIDYERIAPYVLGDEAGGDISSQRYAFRGGYAAELGRWSLGVELAYRAELASRNRDPRVKDVVSDLDVLAGGALLVGERYSAGVHAALNVYKQGCDLDFYNPINEINTFTLTGLGTYYSRFMGNTNKNSGYESIGYGFGLELIPVDRQGLFVSADYRHYRMEQQLRNYNNLTLGYSDNDIVKFELAYRIRLNGSFVMQPQLDGRIMRRKGTENLFGTSVGASYDKIGSRSPYTHDRGAVKFSLPLQLELAGNYVTFVPAVAYGSTEEKYADPVRKLSASHLTPSFGLSYSKIAGGCWLIEASADGAYAKASSKSPLLTDLDVSGALGQCVVNNFDMLKCDRAMGGVKVGISRQLNRFVLSLNMAYDVCDYVDQGMSHAAVVTVGAKF